MRNTTLLGLPFVGICGAPGTGKTSLMVAISDTFKFKGIDLELIHGCPTEVHNTLHYPLGSDAITETQFAIDARQYHKEESILQKGKITNRTVIDAFAHAKANNLNLDSHYVSMLNRVARYTVIIYTPIEKIVPFVATDYVTKEYQRKVDNAIRYILKTYKIPVQVVTGSIVHRSALAYEAIKLKM